MNRQDLEIGGNYDDYYQEANVSLCDSDNVIYFDTGRNAFRFFLLEYKKRIKPDFVVFLPQYICESVLMQFLQSEARIIYYPIKKDFSIDVQWINDHIKINKPDIVLFQTYFASSRVKIKEQISKINHSLLDNNCIWIEDTTHCCMNTGKNIIIGDIEIASLRKWSSLPDGGYLKSNSTKTKWILDCKRPKRENVYFIEKRLEAQLAKRNYYAGQYNYAFFGTIYDESMKIVRESKEIYSMSNYSRKRFASVNWNDYSKKRRQNFQSLLEEFRAADIRKIDAAIERIDDDVVPLYFPVWILEGEIERSILQKKMSENNIFLPIIWPCPEKLKGNIDIDTDWIYKHILAIPCDHRYNKIDMKRIVRGIIENT